MEVLKVNHPFTFFEIHFRFIMSLKKILHEFLN